MKEWKINTKIFSITVKVKMGKIYYNVCGKYRKFKSPKISYIFKKILGMVTNIKKRRID